MTSLAAAASVFERAAKECSTYATYSTGVKAFLEFIAWMHPEAEPAVSFDAVPATLHNTTTHSLFLTYLSENRGLAPSTCRNYMMAVRSTCASDGLQLYVWKGSRPAHVHEGIERTRFSRTRGPAEALTVPILRKLVDLVTNEPALLPSRWPLMQRLNFVTTLLLGFATGIRSGEMMVISRVSSGLRNRDVFSVDEFSGARGTPAPDVLSARHRGPMLLYFWKTKTDQRRVGTVRVLPNLPCALPRYCPSTVLTHTLAAKLIAFGSSLATTGPDSPLLIRDATGRPYTPSHFNDDLNVVLRVAGIPDPDVYVAHSLREGLSTGFAIAGFPPERYRHLFGWSSSTNATMCQHYSHASLAEVLGMQRTVLSASGPQVLVPLPRVLRRTSHSNGQVSAAL